MNPPEPPAGKHLTSWPDWILPAGPNTPAALNSIAAARERIWSSIKDGYSYANVMVAELDAVEAEFKAQGAIRAKDRYYGLKSITPTSAAAVTYNIGSPGRTFKLICTAKQIGVVQFIDAAQSALNAGSLMVGLTCFRSIIEHVAHLHLVVKELKNVVVPPTHEAANKLLWETDSALAKRCYGTRVDWNRLLEERAAGISGRKSVSYKPQESGWDLTSAGIMDVVDELDKQLRKTRAIYEVLCEFAHPNLGAVYGITSKAEPFTDSFGVEWVRKRVSLDPPSGAVRDCGPTLDAICAHVAKCVRHFEELLQQSPAQAKILCGLAQEVLRPLLRPLLKKKPPWLSVYDLCPCGSGAKLKFCCWSRKD